MIDWNKWNSFLECRDKIKKEVVSKEDDKIKKEVVSKEDDKIKKEKK